MRAIVCILAVGVGLGICLMPMALCPAQSRGAEGTAPSPRSTLPSPEALLRASERMGRNFSIDDRSFQLFRLAEVASELSSESSRQLVRDWSVAMFHSAQERSPDWNRGAFEKNAVELLSHVDPDEAFVLLKKVDPPDLGSHPPPPEDLRAFGARTVFVEFWKQRGVKSLPAIREAALSFGRNGEYPFPAVASILGKLGSSNAEDEFAQETFADALRCYGVPTTVQSSDRDFVEFLEVRWASLDRSSKLAALRAAVGRLTSPRESEPGTRFASRVSTTEGAASFGSEQMLLLYQILGKIHEVDPDWAAKLESDYPEIAQAGGAGVKTVQASQATIEDSGSNASPDAATSKVAKGLQSGTLQQLRKAVGSDLNLAMRLLPQLTDPEFHVEGMAAIAVRLSATDPTAAHSMLNSAIAFANGIPADLQAKARALLSVARAAALMKEQAITFSAVAEGFAAAQESVQEDVDSHPGKPYYLARGMNELSKLMEFDMRLDPNDATGRTGRMQDGELKAFLMIDSAEGLIQAASGPPLHISKN